MAGFMSSLHTLLLLLCSHAPLFVLNKTPPSTSLMQNILACSTHKSIISTLSSSFSQKHPQCDTRAASVWAVCVSLCACVFVCVFWADPLSVLGQACAAAAAAVLCCSVLLGGDPCRLPGTDSSSPPVLTDTHRGMLSPCGFKTSASVCEKERGSYTPWWRCTNVWCVSPLTLDTNMLEAESIPELYIFNSIQPYPAPPSLLHVFVWSYCFNLAASGGPWRL